MGKCQRPGCRDRNKNIAVERTILTLHGRLIHGVYCVNCSIEIMNEEFFPSETEEKCQQA